MVRKAYAKKLTFVTTNCDGHDDETCLLIPCLLLMESLDSSPAEIAGYAVFPLKLPSLPSFPHPATHYLYVSPHQPKLPTPTASRSLFLVNIPFDSTELHFKQLFSKQIGLPAGRIESVQLGQKPKATSHSDLRTLEESAKTSRKRKRFSQKNDLKDLKDAALPSTWDRDLQTNGLTAVVLFVDRKSMEIALKTVKSLCKQKVRPLWGDGIEGDLPPLGYARMCKNRTQRTPLT